ncbi:MAG: dipeptide epimerase [Lachnospiraceae bacterium]|nr:dipeptide epimerase [Lachnospiraceae bacterium]
MKIKSVSIGYVSIPLVTPFKTALRTVDSVQDLIVCVEAENGEIGFGEAPPTAVITGDTKESIEAAIRFYIAPAVCGMDLDDPEAIFAAMEKCIAKNTSAKAAVDIALYDLLAKLNRKPLFRLLGEQSGSSVRTELETDLTISVNEIDEMVRDSISAVNQGFRILKVKVGKGGEKDVARIREIRQAVGPDVLIRVDANQGWTREEAVRTITMMEDAGLQIELVEQPVSCHDFKGLKYVTDACETPILADESVFSVEDAERIIEEHAADYLNIKLMKTGGIHNALRICDLADQNGIRCMAGCMLESKVSVSAAAHLTGARSCITMADLDGPSLCSIDPYEGGPIFEGAKIILPDSLYGIGISKVPADFEVVASC